ncbi:MAG: UDP-3-O-(3-hydroxymyristoyl)glucosamine N-acyltransferase [Deltaproteobacteria bacterium]|nr:UDP-3-O-(3-hydroxymyristoyl)glucosamine N-acyltransferase [Deltaproteobacteria bacterium]
MATVGQLALLINGTVIGDGKHKIEDVAELGNATSAHLSFYANPKYQEQFAKTKAGAVLCREIVEPAPTNLIICPDPYLALAHIATYLHPIPSYPVGIEDGAHVAQTAIINDTATIRVGAIIEAGARVGARSIIGPGVYLGPNAVVGDDCFLHPQVCIQNRCQIGDRVILHSGVVIGSDGFGFAPDQHGVRNKIPQIGIVVIENDVEIGANTTIDRATFGETRIGAGTKIDNLVQIAHNVALGENCVIASQTGIAGSTKLGNQVIIGAQTGIVGHIHLTDGIMLGARTGVSNTIDKPGIYSGTPAIPHNKWRKVAVIKQSLPELRRRIIELEQRLAALECQSKA